ncbi:hypothetical protein ACOSP7_024314 [Xanthoceras sorbifolium]
MRRVTDSTVEPLPSTLGEQLEIEMEHTEGVVQRVMRDFVLPIIEKSPSCILLDDLSRNYELKNIHFNMLPSFYGHATEDPLTFMREFYNTIYSFPLQRLFELQLRMRCFPYMLKDKAKQWLMTLPAGSLRTWSEVYRKFMRKFYFHQKTAEMRMKITNFSQGDGELFHEAWDRFKLLIIQCPHHGFSLELQNQFFYDGLSMNRQAMVDNAVGGVMQEKSMDKAYELFEMLGANSQQKSFRGKTQAVHEVHTNTGLAKQIYDVLSKVNVNLPLLDMIKKMPSYGKFFREINKRKRQYGAVLQQKFLPKLKYPGDFNIDITIENVKKERAMLDLGVNINLMPYSVYIQLGLNELKPTSMSMLLADRLTRYSRGIVEDILIQVDKLIIPVDFVVLDMDDAGTIETDLPILLGRPFMATSHTIIDVKNGKLSVMPFCTLKYTGSA